MRWKALLPRPRAQAHAPRLQGDRVQGSSAEQDPTSTASEAMGAASVPPHVRPNCGSSGAAAKASLKTKMGDPTSICRRKACFIRRHRLKCPWRHWLHDASELQCFGLEDWDSWDFEDVTGTHPQQRRKKVRTKKKPFSCIRSHTYVSPGERPFIITCVSL